MALGFDVKSRLFFSLMLLCGVAVVGEVLHQTAGVSNAQAVLMSLAVGLVGLTVWGIARFRVKPERKAAPAIEAKDADCPSEGPLTFFKQPQYWGGVLFLGGLVLVIYILVFAKTPPPPKHAVQASPKPVAPTPEVRFPDLTLQGVTLRGSNSSAVINGRVVQLGGRVEGVQVTEIDGESVSVVLDGQTNQIHLVR